MRWSKVHVANLFEQSAATSEFNTCNDSASVVVGVVKIVVAVVIIRIYALNVRKNISSNPSYYPVVVEHSKYHITAIFDWNASNFCSNTIKTNDKIRRRLSCTAITIAPYIHNSIEPYFKGTVLFYIEFTTGRRAILPFLLVPLGRSCDFCEKRCFL